MDYACGKKSIGEIIKQIWGEVFRTFLDGVRYSDSSCWEGLHHKSCELLAEYKNCGSFTSSQGNYSS